MTSADKLGMVVAVAVVIIFVGLGVGMSNVSEDNARPDIDQQRAVPITEDLMKPKVTLDPGPIIDTGDYGTGSSETCSADPPPPPGPGVNWDYCDISENDYSGEDLSGASMIGTTAHYTNFEGADLSDVVATNGIFTYADFDHADVTNGDFSDSNLGRADFDHGTLDRTIFDGADLSGTSFMRAYETNVSFDDVKFEWAETFGMAMPMWAHQEGTLRGEPTNFEVSNSQFYMSGGQSNFEDITLTNNVLWTFWIQSSSISDVDFSTQVVNTGHFSISDEEISLMGTDPGGFQYNADSNLECSEHVICDDPDPRLIRTGLLSVIPHPEITEQVTIGGPLWVGPIHGHADDDWSNCYIGNIICYYPQVATILKGGTVTWFNHDTAEKGHQLVSGKPSTGHDGMWKSPVILPGEEWSKIFPSPGKYHYYDILNPEWVGQVIVFGKGSGGLGDPNNPNYPPKDPQDKPKSDGLKQQLIPKIKPTIPIEPTIPMKPLSPMGANGTDPDNCWNLDEFGNKFYDPSGIPAPPSPGVDWDYCNLDGHDYSGEDLSYATIRFGSTVETDFSNTLLNNAQFGMPSGLPPMHVAVTDSTDAIFTGANGKDTQFQGVTLNGANFDNAKMPRVLFEGAGMTDVSMRHAYMPEASLMWTNVIHSDLRNANLKYSDMTHVNLESTDLSNAMLYRVIFDEGLLVDAWFTNAHMDESTLRNVDGSAGHTIDRISKYDDASMKEVIICNSNFNDATFEDADLTTSVFNDCERGVDEISFLGTNLHNANFDEVFIPAVGPSSFPSMIDGTSPISGESTDKSCILHPYCDLEPVPGDTFVPDTFVPDTSGPDTSVPDMSDSIFTEIDGEYFYDVDGELLPVHSGDVVALIKFTEGSAFPGCESTEDGCYLPSTLVKEIGLRVIWVNDDTSPHTVTSGSPADGPDGYFDSSLMMGDDSFEFPFEEEGTFDYFCMVHPWMSGTVIIVPETPDD